MAITDVTSTSSQTTATLNTAANKTASDLGIDDFLALMTAQLKNQDPMKPLDSTEFVAQLASFGSVSGIQKMQTSLETLAASLRSTQALNGASMVGREILVPATEASIVSGGTVSGEIEVPDGTASLSVSIKDSAGQTVRTLTLTPTEGVMGFTWDGLQTDGTAAPTGTYEFETLANIGGENYSLETLFSAKVSSVSLDAQGTELTLNTATLGSVSLADVRRVM